MTETPRKYKLKRRAERQEQTRDRIVEATMALHEELGPREATISAIAERAGVQRLTVYRHFPDDQALFQACTSRWIERNPPPGPEQWHQSEQPVDRTRVALTALYGYYRRTERMWTVSYRDEAEVAALQAPMAGFRAHLAMVRDDLLAAWSASGGDKRPLSVTLAHAVDFPTWQSLARLGLQDDEAAELVVRWLTGVGSRKARQT